MTTNDPARSTPGPSDEALLAAMASGDAWAATAFVRRYQGRVFGLAIRILGDASAAEDVAQEALVRAWRHAPVFDARRGSVSTWVLTIARNVAIDALRLRRSLPMADDELARLAASAASEGAIGAVGTNDAVRRALAELPAEQRRALVLSGLYGFTAAEVAEIEKIPLGTAKTRIRTGLSRFGDAFENEEELR